MNCAAAFLLSALALTAHAAEPDTLRLTRTIPLLGVTGRFDHFAIDVPGRRLFVAALGNNTLEVVDLTAGKRLQSISGMSKPTGVLYLPASKQVLVANGDEGALKILDAATFKLAHNMTGVDDADNLRFNPATHLAYLGYGAGALGVIDTVTARLTASIKLSGHPESFQLEREGDRIFVNVPDARQVAVIDRDRRAVIATWPMEEFQANFPMALDEVNHRLFLGCRRPARLAVLDTTTGRPVADIAISGDTDDLFYDAARKRLYVSCGEGFIDVVEQRDADSYQLRERIPTRPGARTSFFSKDLDEFYLAVPQRGNQPAEVRVYRAQN